MGVTTNENVTYSQNQIKSSPKKMPPLRPSSSSNSDSDSDAPEAVSLSHSKKSIQNQNANLRKAKALAREKTKQKNRTKDQKLKERAAKNKKAELSSSNSGTIKYAVEDAEEELDDEDDEEARMLRAMRDAEGEEDEEGEGDGELDEDSEDEDFAEFQEGSDFDSVGMDEEDLLDAGEDDSEEASSDEEMEDNEDGLEDQEMDSSVDSETPPPPKTSSNYLPDELFKAAFSQTSKSNPTKAKKPALPKKELKKRKRTSSAAPKDIIVGFVSNVLSCLDFPLNQSWGRSSRAIRTLSSTNRPISSKGAVPSAKINKFLDRTLALKGQKPVPGKGWQRRPGTPIPRLSLNFRTHHGA
jgi:hypothetical protein